MVCLQKAGEAQVVLTSGFQAPGREGAQCRLRAEPSPVSAQVGSSSISSASDTRHVTLLATRCGSGSRIHQVSELDYGRLVMRRGFDLVEGGSATADFLNDLFCWLVPHKRFGIFVPCDRPRGQSLDKGTHAREHAASQPASGQVGEPAPHEVEPRRTGGHEMQVPARLFSLRKPTFHLWAMWAEGLSSTTCTDRPRGAARSTRT